MLKPDVVEVRAYGFSPTAGENHGFQGIRDTIQNLIKVPCIKYLLPILFSTESQDASPLQLRADLGYDRGVQES